MVGVTCVRLTVAGLGVSVGATLPEALNMSPKTPAFTFENALAELEQLVQRMESGELSLEESLQAFEQGVKLTRQCQQALSSAEQRVQLLLEQNGQCVALPFSGEQ